MKYPALKESAPARSRSLTVVGFDYGINYEAGDKASEDCVLAECNNMNYRQDALKTRPGFVVKGDSLISPLEDDEMVFLPFTVTQTVFYKNSRTYNLAYCCTGYNSRANLRFFLVGFDGNILPAGSIVFNRVDYLNFFVPENVFFTVTGEEGESRVYAFIHRLSRGESVCEIYRANETFSTWSLAGRDCYVPTVLINGRGERYDEAHSLGEFNYPDPEKLEELNMLTPLYKCFFTSDGLSHRFRLPYGNLDQYSDFVCRLYSTPDTYTEWVVPGDYDSCSRTVGGVTVTLFLDRTLGLISFHTQNGEYHVPVMSGCNLNNISVVSSTFDANHKEAIISSHGAVSLDNRLYFYGNTSKPNCIYCSKIADTLYFPESSKLFIGDGASGVTALRVQNGKLIAFKPGETYKVTTSFRDEKVTRQAVLPDRTVYVRSDILSAQTIDASIGCSNPSTLRLCGSRLVWLSDDGNVYALATTTYGNTTNIYKVSQPLGGKLKEKLTNATNVFAVTSGGEYLLSVDDTVFVMNYRVRGFGYSRTYYSKDDKLKSPAWFIWKLPQNSGIYSAGNVAGNAIFVSNFSSLYFVPFTLSGACDTVAEMKNGSLELTSTPVTASLKLKNFDFSAPHRLKRLDTVLIDGKCDNTAELTVYDRERCYTVPFTIEKSLGYIRLDAGIPAAAEISLGVCCESPISVSGISLIHRILSVKG